ncbi:hypothetical protein [Burkholderia sp. LMU1-1-1.1]|uniref:hypothetical protein n=1 Tax=Burkholderia sp. LMU1-1-1.1 TaxID=3135266 RepID=UPI00341B7E8F
MRNIIRKTNTYIGIFLFVQFISGCARADNTNKAPVAAAQLAPDSAAVEIISNLADFSTFRKTSDFFDSVLRTQCKKKNSIKDEDGISSKYICDPASGLKIVDIDTRQPKGEAPYLMSLRLTFSYSEYPKVKKIIQKKLGRPSRDNSTLTTWSYKTDKELNEYGDPTVAMSRDKELSVSVFQLGLEQGP